MIMTPTEWLQRHNNLCAILDAAKESAIAEVADRFPDHSLCLYNGDSAKDLKEQAPYVFDCSQPELFAELKQFWGANCGSFLQSTKTIHDLKSHFRKFVIVTLPDGVKAYFRFYDPRVIRPFLHAADPNQVAEFFGPIDKFFVEDRNGTLIVCFRQQNGRLNARNISSFTNAEAGKGGHRARV
ncbi:MAG: DUF4123 domain-containing protein [Planctomycetota bacterium]